MSRGASICAWAWLALMAAGCAATPADEDPTQIKLNDVDARLTRIERVVANQSLLDLSNQTEALRADVRALHNEVDQLTHASELARKQQRDLYADLDQRLKAVEAHPSAAASISIGGMMTAAPGASSASTGAAGGGASAPATADGLDKTSYQAAFNLLKEGQYDRAIVAFEGFLAAYPQSALADNAQYWLGEAFYVNKSYAEALTAFQKVASNYPQSRKLPDALLKMGFCYYELKQFSASRDTLAQVINRFPDSSASGLARQRLDAMNADKH